jgi:ribosomal protein L37AE/L43A
MIRIDFTVAVLFFLLAGIFVLAFWMLLEARRDRKESTLKSELFLWECPVCLYNYINSQEQNISQCPRCKSFHRRNEKAPTKQQESAVFAHHS